MGDPCHPGGPRVPGDIECVGTVKGDSQHLPLANGALLTNFYQRMTKYSINHPLFLLFLLQEYFELVICHLALMSMVQTRVAGVGWLLCTAAESLRAFVERVLQIFAKKTLFFMIAEKQAICGCQKTHTHTGTFPQKPF